MSTDNETCQLHFPLTGEIPAARTLILRDLDVVGVGALRRQQLQELQKTKKFILHTYEHLIPESVHGIYATEILRTLQWLRPFQSVQGAALDLQKEQTNTFRRIFPLTRQYLGMTADRMADLYLEEMEWSSWLLQDHWRYFVGFLRQKFPENKALLELAHWEWVQAWIEVQPFEYSHGESGILEINPSLQVVSLSVANPTLARDQGLYAFSYDEKKATVVEKALDVYEAHILDLLQEDRKYTRKQLLEMTALSDEITTQLSAEEWEKKFLSLQDAGIILNAT